MMTRLNSILRTFVMIAAKASRRDPANDNPDPAAPDGRGVSGDATAERTEDAGRRHDRADSAPERTGSPPGQNR